ncbi:MAG: hypothetical protein KC501_30030 [Myxococcales bacterium]|nr:hypothetical protein [Myxococcales bacterium]
MPVAAGPSPAELEPFTLAERRRRWIGVGASATFGVVVVVALLWVDPLDARIALASLAGLLSAFFVVMIIASRRRLARFLWILERSPEQVVWICPQQHIQAAQHESTTFVLALADGDRVSANVAPEHHARIAALLRRCCPDAELGFSPELQRRFGPIDGRGRPGTSPPPAPWAPTIAATTTSANDSSEPAEALALAIRRAHRLGLLLGYPCAAVTMLFAAITIGVADELMLVLTLLAALGAVALLRWGHRDPRAHRLMVVLDAHPERLSSAELVYTNYAGKPEPELRTEYADGGFDRIGLVPGTEARVMEWISDRRASAA